MSRKIEWPPGSGLVGTYEPDEEQLLRDLIEGGRAGFLDPMTLANEIDFLTGAKALLGAHISPMPGAVIYGIPAPEMPSADSDFQIPPTAAAKLRAAADRQLRFG